jgi:hypothetical protein
LLLISSTLWLPLERAFLSILYLTKHGPLPDHFDRVYFRDTTGIKIAVGCPLSQIALEFWYLQIVSHISLLCVECWPPGNAFVLKNLHHQ